ncbi:class I adenylate-forming enzyme family protein [uncultured Azohydromonas sp.]|jgi:Acyl-CoA synthetases (AMP-forming)/AMP-acid ligases II|uniref:class I adenylate-forming enzyme family protein n=1 Tax=uncultured Azohydromonas sp. TaxID=487342 RepID=UPI00262CEB8A|nr:class I adenylate-forming enzyme family protein [uncultured Azohydromonas sp.]
MSHLLTLHHPAAARDHYLSGVWQHDTLYALACRHADERGTAHALRDATRRLSWSAVVAWADAVAADLHEAGLRSGDRVSVWLPNRLESVIVLLACSRNGYVCNPSLHQNYTVAEVETLLKRIDCAALFAQPGWGADAASADIFARAAGLEHVKRVYALPSLRTADAQLPAGTHAMPWPGQAAVPQPAPSTDPDQVVYLAFTSGTTGAPKGVMHSANTLLANGRAMVADWAHDTSTVVLSLSPMSHHIGTVALEQSLVAGCELVMHDPTAGVAALDWIEATGATYVMGVPTHAMDLLHEMDRRDATRLGRVKVFYMAGAPIPTETARRLLALGATPQNVYGMTECGSHQYTKPTDAVEVITATCGKACAAYEVKLWQPDNPDVEALPGEVGEIGGRGGVLMLGYFSNQSATETSFNRSGWFLSGDLGRFDSQGNLVIVGRKKDLIIRGGHNIHPAHIEEYAHRHPAVKKAAAFGVPDERLGEKVCLALIADGAVDADEMLQHLAREGLSKFDMPEYFMVLPEFPLTASGKILKRELVQWVRDGRVQPQPVRYRAR